MTMTPEEVWRQKTDDEVITAAAQLSDYTEVGQRIIEAEMQRRELTLPKSEDLQQIAPGDRLARWGRYALAALACTALTFAYSAFAVALGWRSPAEGPIGYFALGLLFGVIGLTWRALTRPKG